ncbi:asparagine synthase C-terminal domain-containing protein [Urechidicola vernalis]|uniref:asparagine synthase (glutamine-hydrolyzing) n=1 Tax=Urechidicola vernalis TaxID=3075600 RepID=A0ABU2Y232_9FLAO|nr:asparagine synthase C-terminal domain-containing protein [Urechidicola sp. P050]MDT0552264.1 asparagine synthase C-terminal domain-containing protein [Urechidicola sp. P050]
MKGSTYIKTGIIPEKQHYYKVQTSRGLDLKAICCYAATGFFLEDDTFWKHQKVLKPATDYEFDSQGQVKNKTPYFQWHYNPRIISFEQALDEFEHLFETIISEQTKGKKVILPLSGGLDSRTQAVALAKHSHLQTYSYSFKNGYPESRISKRIANALGVPFTSMEVPKGYLWDAIEDLAEINQCYSDFCNPRQMAFVDQYAEIGEVFSLGHWGDVLFDGMGEDVQWTTEEELNWVLKKVVKKGGMELATRLWESWGLDGDFESYFMERIKGLLSNIDIDNTSAKLRAFKSLYWAPRWTSVNLGVFESVAPITLPYYDNRMCEFICTIPEEYLKDRKLQIAYIQRKSKKVANITWHQQKPFNLNNYHWNRTPYNLPYRVISKIERELRAVVGRPHVARNWELQFLGKENDQQLQGWLFESGFDKLVSKEVIQEFYTNFKMKDAVWYSHSVNMLLTLAVFNKKFGS